MTLSRYTVADSCEQDANVTVPVDITYLRQVGVPLVPPFRLFLARQDGLCFQFLTYVVFSMCVNFWKPPLFKWFLYSLSALMLTTDGSVMDGQVYVGFRKGCPKQAP